MIPVMQRNMKKYLFFRDWTWYFLVNGTKRFIGQVDMEAEIAALEEEAAVACKAYDEVVEVRDRLNGEIEQMTSDKKSMMAQIEAEQGDLSGYQRDLAHASEQKSAKEGELTTTQKKLSDTQEKKQQMTDTKRKLETDLGSFKKDIEDMEISIQKAEQEVTLDELEDSHDREKKSRLEVDKQRRKVEADLKVCQEKVADLEREKKDIEAAIVKKDQDIIVSQRKLEDEQSIVAKAQ